MTTSCPYPAEYIAFLAEFYGSRDFFECHEQMEALWKKEKGGPREGCWLALVRLAVAQYHARRGNGKGAYKLLAKAAAEIDPAAMDGIGLDGNRLAAAVRERLSRWGGPAGVAYADLELPIADAELLRRAREVCAARGWTWGAPGDRADPAVVHRHALRNRREVVAAREAAAEEKAAARRRHSETGDGGPFQV